LAGEPDGDSPFIEVLFGFFDFVFAVVEDTGGEGGAGTAFGEDCVHVFGRAAATAGDDGDIHGSGDGTSHREVVTVLGAVGVHGGEDDFTGTEFFDFARPSDGFESGGEASAIDVDFPEFPAVLLDPTGVDIDDDALAAETERGFADEIGIPDGGGIDGDFVATGVEESADVFESTDATADGQGHEDDFGGALDDIEDDISLLVAGGDVEEDEFVGSFLLVAGGDFDGVSGIAEVEEIGPFDNPSGVDVEAGDDPFGKHMRQSISVVWRPGDQECESLL